ncbi:MAG: secretin and TonB N-terminal domain-containing protein [Candidatus Omnitrophica bacterium]|nr:secretin and TonB N-terminal domain-containing protein [Candidatus Omnitrophota bacterium]
MGDNMRESLSRCLLAVLLVFTVALCSTAAPLTPGEAYAQEKKIEAALTDSSKPKVAAAESSKTAEAGAVAAPSTTESSEVKTSEEVSAPVDPGNVTVNFKGADIRTVLSYISDVAGVDIVPAPDVKGVVDLKLTNKPWKTALDIIVRNYGFAYEREGDIIRVVTLERLKQEELTTQTFNLNYSKSKEVVAAIENVVSDRGKVMYDERTNTVIVTDIPTNIYKISQIISRLDKRTEQVLISARIIETVLGKDEKMGIDWIVKITATGAKRPTTVPFDYFDIDNPMMNKMTPLSQVTTATAQGAGAGSTAVLVPPADFPANPWGAKSFPFALKDDFTFGTLDFTEFKAVLEMLSARSDTEIISNPRVATLNNTPALINVGQTLNMPTYERNSSTGKMEVTGYESKDLGILLQVTPHVNDLGEITVDLAPVISDLLRYDTLDRASGIVAPVFSVRQAKTQIMIKDGDTIFIGGLIKENDIDVKKKLPILGDMLGDVPYLGLLFTKKETTKQKTELIFFITVNLMTTGKQISDVPQSNKAYVPMYTAAQSGDTMPKKRVKKKGQ